MKLRKISVLIAGLFLSVSTFGLSSCGCSPDEKVPPTPDTPEHVHNISEWKSDETNHWHTCDGCDEILDKEAHSFGDWVETKAATCTEKGEKTKTCTVCKYVVKEEIPALGHKPKTTWDSDETHHWHTCETCGEALEKAEHSFGEWTIDEVATCSKVGKRSKTCAICGYKVSEELPKNENAHEYGSYSVTVEPTKGTEGEIKIKCKLDETHIQKVILPVLTSNIYQYKLVEIDSLTKEEYFIFNPGNEEGVKSLFAGTLLEGTTDLEDLIAHRSFGRNTICKHNDLSANYEFIPTNTTDGKLKFECLNCAKSTIITLNPTSIKDYYFTPSLTQEGKGTYNLTLSAASRIYDSSNIAATFGASKINAVKAIKGATFIASEYNLSVELVSELTKPTDTLKLKVFTPRNLDKPQFDLVEINLTKENTEWFEYRFKDSSDCSVPVEKTLHIKQSKLEEFAKTYLDPVCGTVSSHSQIETLLSNLVLATETPTLSEQNAHSKHGLGNMALIRKPEAGPNGATGLVRILCNRHSQDTFQYDLEIPQYTDTNFYYKVNDVYTTTYIVKESVLKSTVFNELKEYFNFTMDAEMVTRFKDIIKVMVNKNVTAELETPISDTSNTFTIGFFVDGVYEESIESTFSCYDSQYFKITYEEKSCNEYNEVYTLNSQGRNLYLKNTGLENNSDMIQFLTNFRAGTKTAPASVIHSNKQINHQFEYVSHQMPTGSSTANGVLKARCSSCGTIFTVSVSKEDIYTSGLSGQEINRDGIENRIQNCYREFSLTEVRAFADVFIFGGYL